MASPTPEAVVESANNPLGVTLQQLGIQPPQALTMGNIFAPSKRKNLFFKPRIRNVGSSLLQVANVNGLRSIGVGNFQADGGSICGIEYATGQYHNAGWVLPANDPAVIAIKGKNMLGVAASGARVVWQITEYVQATDKFEESGTAGGQAFYWNCIPGGTTYLNLNGEATIEFGPLQPKWTLPDGRPFSIVAFFAQLHRGPIELARLGTTGQAPIPVIVWI